MALYRRAASPNLLGPSLSRRADDATESKLNRGSTIPHPGSAPSGLAARYIPTPLPSQTEFPLDMQHETCFAPRSQYTNDFSEDMETPRASHHRSSAQSVQDPQRAYRQQVLYAQPGTASGIRGVSTPSTLLTPRALHRSGSSLARTSGPSVSDYGAASGQDGRLHEALSRPFFHGPPHHLQNLCRCNNIICTLFRSPDAQLASEPVSSSHAPRILVHLEHWRLIVEGRRCSRTGRLKPARVGELVAAVHEMLHEPIKTTELDAIYLSMSEADQQKTRQLMVDHMYASTGRYPNFTKEEMYQKIDYLERNNIGGVRDAMYLERLERLASDPAEFVVALF